MTGERSDKISVMQPVGSRRAGVRWRPIILIGGALGLYFVMTRPMPVPAGWVTNYDAALGEAAASDRKLLVAFNMKGCPACNAMDRMVLSRGEVKSALKAFIPVRVDVDREREVANRFEVFGTPTYAVVDAEGTLLAKCEGFQPVERFLEFLNRASTLPTSPP